MFSSLDKQNELYRLMKEKDIAEDKFHHAIRGVKKEGKVTGKEAKTQGLKQTVST